jgi:hypothetical protein
MSKTRDPSKNQATAAEKAQKHAMSQPPPIDKLLIPGIAFCVLAVFLAIFKEVFFSTSIAAIDVTDSLQLRAVFFAGEDPHYKGSYVLQCYSTSERAESKALNSAFVDAAKLIDHKMARFGTIDCDFVLPDSGLSIMEKFKIDPTRRPAAVFISGGRLTSPKQLSGGDLKSGNLLAKGIKNILEPKSAKLETSKHLKSRCLSFGHCLLLLKGGEVNDTLKNDIKKLVSEFPEVQFAHVDSNLLEMNLEKKMKPFEVGSHRVVMFKRVDGEDDGEEESEKSSKKSKPSTTKLTTSAKSYKSGDYSYDALKTFISGGIETEDGFKTLPATPKLSVRTKKNAEKAKKEKYKKENGGAEPPVSKEERKAERERQRQRAKKEREATMTPEEIEAERLKFEAERREKLAASMKAHVIDEEEEVEEDVDDEEEDDEVVEEEWQDVVEGGDDEEGNEDMIELD